MTTTNHVAIPSREPLRDHAYHRRQAFDARSDAACATIAQAFLPCSIEREDAAELARLAIRYRFEPDALVLRREAPSDALWLVEKGLVTVGLPDRHGRWRQTRSVGPGQWLDVASAWLGGNYLESAKATTHVTAYEIPLEDLRALCTSHPQIAAGFIEAMALRIKQGNEAAHSLAVRDVLTRIASWLLENIGQEDVSRAKVVIPQLKSLLASELGATPETFSRALSRLKYLGLIAVRGYTVEVLDLEGLRQLVGGKPSRRLVDDLSA